MPNVVTILGIDPGFGRVGWCIGKVTGADLKISTYDCIETAAQLTLPERYQQIQHDIQKIITEFHPTEAALESLFFTKNQKTALHVSEARGVIIGELLRDHISCFDYTPLQVKQTVTGFGKADKAAVERMLRLQFDLDHAKILDDTMDAIGITVTHAASRILKQKL